MAGGAPLTPEQRAEVQAKVHAVFARIIGIAALVIGMVASALTVWTAYRAMLLEHPSSGLFAFIGLFAAVAGFFLYVGWRLGVNRPNRHGSILGPAGWRVLGALFTLTGVGLFAAFLTSSRAITLELVEAAAIPVVSCGVFAYLCFRCASRTAAMPPDARL